MDIKDKARAAHGSLHKACLPFACCLTFLFVPPFLQAQEQLQSMFNGTWVINEALSDEQLGSYIEKLHNKEPISLFIINGDKGSISSHQIVVQS